MSMARVSCWRGACIPTMSILAGIKKRLTFAVVGVAASPRKPPRANASLADTNRQSGERGGPSGVSRTRCTPTAGIRLEAPLQ